MKQNCLIIAGEKSGEEHCLEFFRDLKEQCPQISFWGVGGDRMAQEGFENLFHLHQFSNCGFSDVFFKLFFYFKALRKILHHVERRKCKAAVLIDFQEFNLHLARKLKKRRVKVVYFVAPQAWAWRSYRSKIVKKTVEALFTILPFEKSWFEKRGVRRVFSVPHPVLSRFESELPPFKHKTLKDPITVLLLPGSRNSEVRYMLPDFCRVLAEIKKNRQVKSLMVCTSSVQEENYRPYLHFIDQTCPDTQLTWALQKADVCIATSGTVTLTTALFCVPTVVCYKVSLFNEFVLDLVMNYRGYFCLANILHQKEVFPEFYQERMSVYNIRKKISNWICDAEEYRKTREILAQTRKLLTGEGISVARHIKQVIEDAYLKTCS